MLITPKIFYALAVVTICATVALGTPIIDGSVTANEYDIVVGDTPNETGYDFYNTGLDIATIQFDGDDNWAYLALTVVDEPIDTDGGPTSFLSETIFMAAFYDTGADIPSYLLEVSMRGSEVEVELEKLVSGSWQTVPLADADYDVAVGNALEIRLAASVVASLLDLENPYCLAQLDDTGTWDDDQIGGQIPEPATLGLLTLGGTVLLARRRRRTRPAASKSSKR